MTDESPDPSNQPRQKTTTVALHVVGWPLFLLGLGAWCLAVIPYMVAKAQHTETMEIDQSMVGLGTVIYLVFSGAGLGFLAGAMGKKHLTTQILSGATSSCLSSASLSPSRDPNRDVHHNQSILQTAAAPTPSGCDAKPSTQGVDSPNASC